MKNLRSILFIIILLSVFVSFAETTLVYAEVSDPITFDPFTSNDIIVARISGLLYKKVLDLASTKPVFRGSNTELLVNLRDDMKWSDGSPLTAKDVVFTFNLIKHLNTTYKYLTDRIDNIEIISNNLLKFTFKRSSPYNFYSINFPVLSQRAVKNLFFIPSYYKRHPVSSAFYLYDPSKSTIGTRYYFELNYYNNSDVFPFINQIILRIIRDKETMVSEAMNGKVDLLIDIGKAASEKLRGLGYNIFSNYEPRLHYLIVNQNLPSSNNDNESYQSLYTLRSYMRNPIFREAIIMAINRRQMLKSIYQDEGIIVTGPILPQTPYYDDTILPYQYNPKKAKSLLESLGFFYKNNKCYYNYYYKGEKKSKQVILKFKVSKGSKDLDERVESIKRDLEDIGIKTIIYNLDWNKFYDDIFIKKDYDLTTLSFYTSTGDPALYSFLDSKGVLNCEGYLNQKMDNLIELAEKSNKVLDISQRESIYKQIHRLFHNDLPLIPLWQRKTYLAISPKFDVPTNISPMNPFEDIQLWKLKEG